MDEFTGIKALEEARLGSSCLPDRGLATALFLELRVGKPPLLEGEAGVGKTEAARALASSLGLRLIRLQCYEGLDVAHAVYEWNYTRQLLHIHIGLDRVPHPRDRGVANPRSRAGARAGGGDRRRLGEWNPDRRVVEEVQRRFPYVDRFLPGHNIASLEDLAQTVSAIDRRHAA
ncbi:MAG: MoxR family ATPase [Solirubrobacteraceae bacterium]